MDPRRRRASRDDAPPTGVRGRLPRGERATRRARRGRAPPPPPRAWLQSRRPPTRARARLGCCRCTSAAYGLAVPRGRPGIGAGERGARARVPWAIAHLRSEAACVRFARTPCRSRAGVRRARGAKCARARHPLRSAGFNTPCQARAAKSGRAPSANLEAEKRTRAARCQPEWIKERIPRAQKVFWLVRDREWVLASLDWRARTPLADLPLRSRFGSAARTGGGAFAVSRGAIAEALSRTGAGCEWDARGECVGARGESRPLARR